VRGRASLLLTSHFLLRCLRVSRRERHSVGKFPIEADFKGVLSRTGERNVEDQHGPSLDVNHSGWRLPELYGAFTTEELGTALVDKTDADSVSADLGAPPANPKHEVGARVDRGKVGQPHVLKHAEHAELALLIDKGVIGDHGKVEVQGSGDSDGRDDVVLLDLVHHIHAIANLTEDGVHPIEVRLW
jgi:hypothetical protein